MSRFSANHHIRLPQVDVLRYVEAFLWNDLATFDVRILPLSSDPPFFPEEVATAEKLLSRHWLISPTDASGWTALWGDWGAWPDESLIAYIAAEAGCNALYGHNNDQTDNWRWIEFSQGKRHAEYWYTGQLWYRFPDRYPPEAPTLPEVFQKAGRQYLHETPESMAYQLWFNKDSGFQDWRQCLWQYEVRT